MNDLESARPSPTDIERLIAPIQKRIEHDARIVVFVCLLGGVLAAIAGLVAATIAYQLLLSEKAKLALFAFVVIGVIPALIGRALRRSRLRLAPKLLRDGAPFPASIQSATLHNGAHMLVVAWEDRGTDRAKFDVKGFDPKQANLQLFVHRSERWVGVILNDRLYIPLRNQYVHDAES
jgi:hypothetical protein